MEEIANEYNEKAKVCKVNTDEHREAAVEYAINAIPTIIFFNNWQVEKKCVGLTTKKDITAELDQLIWMLIVVNFFKAHFEDRVFFTHSRPFGPLILYLLT